MVTDRTRGRSLATCSFSATPNRYGGRTPLTGVALVHPPRIGIAAWKVLHDCAAVPRRRRPQRGGAEAVPRTLPRRPPTTARGEVIILTWGKIMISDKNFYSRLPLVTCLRDSGMSSGSQRGCIRPRNLGTRRSYLPNLSSSKSSPQIRFSTSVLALESEIVFR